jgi:acetylglutamate kinase
MVLTDVEGLYANWPDTDEIIASDHHDRAAGAAAQPGLRDDPQDGGLPGGGRGRRPAGHHRGRTQPHSLLLEIFTDEGVGTMVVPA